MNRHFAEAVTPKSESPTTRPRCRWQVATSFLEAAAWDREGNKFCSPGYQPLDTPWFGTTSAKSLVPLASPLHLFHLKYPCKNTPREDVGRCCAKHSLAPRMAFSRSPAQRASAGSVVEKIRSAIVDARAKEPIWSDMLGQFPCECFHVLSSLLLLEQGASPHCLSPLNSSSLMTVRRPNPGEDRGSSGRSALAQTCPLVPVRQFRCGCRESEHPRKCSLIPQSLGETQFNDPGGLDIARFRRF